MSKDARVAQYLRFRGLSGAVPASIKFAPALEYHEADGPVKKFPAMVAEVRLADGELVTLHRTYLDPRGQGKAPVEHARKLMPPVREGATMGAAIRLAEITDDDEELALAEGIETGLAVQEATGIPTWATVSANGLKNVAITDKRIKTVRIFADNDRSYTGQHAALDLKKSLEKQGLKAFVHLPRTQGTDWLDVLNDFGPEAIRRALEADPQDKPNKRALTDTGNAERLLDLYGRDLRFDHEAAAWYCWSGKTWERDREGRPGTLAREAVRQIHHEAAFAPTEEKEKKIGKWALASQSAGHRKAMVELARFEPGVAITSDRWEADKWLLNCQNGTLDLKTAELRPHRRRDLITKIATVNYDPTHPAPRFYRFLDEITQGNEELQRYLKAVAGYSLTGDVREDVFFVHHGHGRNGKGTFLNLFRKILGNYAEDVSPETFSHQTRAGQAAPELVAIKGARYVLTSESEDGARLNESLIKRLTGRDPITARPLYGAPISFWPECKLHYLTNHKPHVQGTDNGIWSRIRLVPWNVSFAGREERTLETTLWSEAPGVLAWAVAGLLDWLENGLPKCAAVDGASKDYRAAQDKIGQFLDECTEKTNVPVVKGGTLYKAYCAWAAANGFKPMNNNNLSEKLLERGYQRTKRNDGNMWNISMLNSE